jgi:hypothetical protein
MKIDIKSLMLNVASGDISPKFAEEILRDEIQVEPKQKVWILTNDNSDFDTAV